MILVELIYNLSVLVALSVLSGFLDTRYDRKKMTGKILQGLLFGAVVIIGMMNPFVFTEGIIFDGRSIVISLCTLFFGPISGVISTIIGILFRIYLGGGGTLMGTLVIAESFLIGYLFYYLREKESVRLTNLNLYIFGLIVNVMMVILMTTLPSKFAADAFKLIAVTVLGFYPVITLLIGKVLSDQEENRKFVVKLKESEEKFRSITENSYNLISLIDFEGRYLYCNQSYKDVLGFKPEELIGKSSFELIHPDERGNVILLLKESLKNNVQTVTIQINLKCSNGLYKLINLRAKMISKDIKYRGSILIVAQDITEQKKAEDALVIAKDRAEESDRLKTAFLQNMSHEIRTPLNGILGFAELLKEKNLDRNEIEQYSEIIRTSGRRLLELINNIIDISRIETGNVKIHNSSISMNTLIKDILSQFLFMLKESRCELRSANPANEDIIFESDSLRLHQILTNLVNNALKFTPEGLVEIGYELKGDEILFIVKDTGIGISKEHREKIFDRFYQTDMSMSRGFEGAGLGLAICRGLVELLKGRIWLESESGEGTTFYFTIPYKPVAKKKEEKQDEDVIMRNKDKLILLAEDDDTSFEYLQLILNKENIEIIRAANGKLAVELCKSRDDIDLVLMDIKMPVMNGLLATELIKKHKPDLPVIAQTAYAFATERDEAIKLGCDDYITKPIDKDELFAILSRYFKN